MGCVVMQVFWLQTAKLYVDIRVPVPVPAASAKSLDTCSEEELAQLAVQQGFAGTMEVKAGCCHWARELDFQPAGGPADIGKMTFVSSERVGGTG